MIAVTHKYRNKLNKICQIKLNLSKETYSDNSPNKDKNKWKKGDRIVWENDTDTPLVLKGTMGYD
jgi:hypothetical protein